MMWKFNPVLFFQKSQFAPYNVEVFLLMGFMQQQIWIESDNCVHNKFLLYWDLSRCLVM